MFDVSRLVLPSLFFADLDCRGDSVATLAKAGVPDATLLGPVRTELKALVDREAEALRDRLIMPGSGQAMEYQQTQAEAAAALAAPATAVASAFPMLAASVGIDTDPQTGKPAADILGVARAVTASFDGWTAIGAAIRKTRLQAKAAIDAAATVADAGKAYAAIAWPPLD